MHFQLYHHILVLLHNKKVMSIAMPKTVPQFSSSGFLWLNVSIKLNIFKNDYSLNIKLLEDSAGSTES